jgi:hypothetical protein
MKIINDNLEVGTKFRGNINNALMEIIKIENSELISARGTTIQKNPVAVIKNLKNGKITTYGLEALKRCNITILN